MQYTWEADRSSDRVPFFFNMSQINNNNDGRVILRNGVGIVDIVEQYDPAQQTAREIHQARRSLYDSDARRVTTFLYDH